MYRLPNAINEAVGAEVKRLIGPFPLSPGVDADFAKLVEEMNAGSVGASRSRANPAYSWFDAEKFKSGLKKLKPLFL